MNCLLAIGATVLVGSSATAARLEGVSLEHFSPPAKADDSPVAPQSLDAAIQSVLQKAVPCVVRISFGDGDMLSGTIISEDGLVLTCAHLPVPIGEAVEVGLSDGRRVPAKVLSKLPERGQDNLGRDLALLQISQGGPWPWATLAAAAPTSTREPVLAMGFPDTLLYGPDRTADPLYVRLGYPINTAYKNKPESLVTSINGVGGDSGGPLFDLAGRVVGVVHGGDTSGAHLNHTRIEVLGRNWERLAPGKPKPAASDEPLPAVMHPSAIVAAAEPTRGAVVEIDSNARWVALGCVVGDGLILTKASELGPNLTVVLPNNYVAIAEVAATDPARDLALLRLPHAADLTRASEPVRWEGAQDAAAGMPVILATPADLTPLVGIVCFAPRSVPPIEGIIPCQIEQAEGGPRVARIIDEIRVYRMRQAPLLLRKGDMLVEIEGIPISDAAAYGKLMYDSSQIGTHPKVSGQPIGVTYRRGDATSHATVILEFSRTPSGQLVRPVSNRYSGFASALATDLAIRPEHCGAPVVDSSGRVVGLLIARAPFIETLVLPANEVAASLKAMVDSAALKR